MIKHAKCLVAVLMLISVSACTPATKILAPELSVYDEDFRIQFSEELREVCPPQQGAYPHTCIFIEDSLILRKEIKAISE